MEEGKWNWAHDLSWVGVASISLLVLFWWGSSTEAGRGAFGITEPPPTQALSLLTAPLASSPQAPCLAAWYGPPPTLQGVKRGKDTVWVTVDPQPGDKSYRGTYVRSGSHCSRPAFTNGTRWIWWSNHGTPGWVLSTGVGFAGPFAWPYRADTSHRELPGNPWRVVAGYPAAIQGQTRAQVSDLPRHGRRRADVDERFERW